MALFSFDNESLTNYIDVFDNLTIGDDAELVETVVMAGAAKLNEKMREYLHQNHFRTGSLEYHISTRRTSKSAFVGPHSRTYTREFVDAKGRKTKHKVRSAHKGSGGVSDKSKHKGGKGYSTYEEIGYYLEYGTPRMKATHWMETSVENAMDEFDEAVGIAWEDYLGKKGIYLD